MSDPLLPAQDGQTALSDAEREGLIPSYITLHAELNEAEQANILDAEHWAFRQRDNMLSVDILNDLHKRMFGRVWKWAGRFRTTGKNVGVSAYRIRTDLQELINDCSCWIDNGTYEVDEIAARFHHRLVQIHPYPNGNGRHARLAADVLLARLGRQRFTWGSKNLVDSSETRTRYIDALRAADRHDYAPLLAFVRS